MSAFIARAIEREAEKSTERGQAKYRAYFVRTRLYEKWRAEVDSILDVDGYSEVITTD